MRTYDSDVFFFFLKKKKLGESFVHFLLTILLSKCYFIILLQVKKGKMIAKEMTLLTIAH